MRKVTRDQRAIAKAVRAAREAVGLSARELSVRIGRSPNYISRIESLASSPGKLEPIAKALGIRHSTLLARAERAG